MRRINGAHHLHANPSLGMTTTKVLKEVFLQRMPPMSLNASSHPAKSLKLLFTGILLYFMEYYLPWKANLH